MKKYLLLTSIFSLVFLISSCKKDDPDDLTTNIVGTYIGSFGSSASGSIDDFVIKVERTGTNRIRIEPNVGTTFAGFEVDISASNSSVLVSVDAPSGTSVTFGVGSPVTCTISRAVTGEVISYVGAKQ
jgi:hypothetical protein